MYANKNGYVWVKKFSFENFIPGTQETLQQKLDLQFSHYGEISWCRFNNLFLKFPNVLLRQKFNVLTLYFRWENYD